MLKSDTKVAATIIFAATINSAPTVEPSDCHGGCEEPALQHGYGSGQLRAEQPVRVVGGHRYLGDRGPLPPG